MKDNPENNRVPKYNKVAMETMIQNDPFLLMNYNGLNTEHDKKVRLIFNTYILDNYDMRQKYRETVRLISGPKTKG